MISLSMLDALQDADLRTVIEQSEGLLKRRDGERKAKALEDARSILAAVGLSLKDLGGNGKRKSAKGPVYHAGHTYQHPANKALVWNGKGKKPGWLTELEAQGGEPLEVANG
jgi:DNA-binding protein H-NS